MDLPAIIKMNIEVYEYKLNNYPYNLNTESDNYKKIEIKTDKLYSSSPEECGIIETEKNDDIPPASRYHNPYEINTSLVRSCDPIKGKIKIVNSETIIPLESEIINFSIDGITSSDLLNYSNLNGAKKLLTTTFNRIRDNTMEKIYNAEYIESIVNRVKNILKNDWIDNTIEFDREDNYSYTDDKTLIKILRPDINQKYIIFGDFHGSFHTFLRHLFRFRLMGMFNENCILHDNYHLIFLGDVIDRGSFGYEILILIFILKVLNPNNIHINRGNHEELETNEEYGFLEELDKKMPDMMINDVSLHIFLNNIMLYQHSALLIKNPTNEKFSYLAHGGLPLSSTIDSVVLLERFKNVYPESNNIILVDDITIKTANSIRWSDFYGKNKSVKQTRSLIGTNILDETNDKIDIIIRGHEDGSYNTKLIKKNSEKFTNINTLPAYNIPIYNNNVQCKKFIHRITINDDNEIIVNNRPENNFIKVLTISNNTDIGRDLDRDSFVILKYILNDIGDSNCIIKDAKPMLGGYYKKYLKYKQKYLQLKNKI